MILPVEHPILNGLGTYTSVDEPYLFKDVAPDRTILTVRDGPVAPEAMSWVRQQGLGRVFYHSGGHDERTWIQPNFQEIVTRGIEWVAKPGDGPPLVAIDRARIGNGGAIAVKATLAGSGEETLRAVFLSQGGKWHRPLLKGETLFESGTGAHEPEPSDALRVGGQAALPLMATSSTFSDAGAVTRQGLWTGRGGLVRLAAKEGDALPSTGGDLTLVPAPAGQSPELVMNAGGMTVARVFVSREGFPDQDTALLRAGSGSAGPEILLVEGDDLGEAESPWICGDLSGVRLTLNNPGQLAAILPGTAGGRLMSDDGSGWAKLLQVGEGVPGLAGDAVIEELLEARLNDAGDLVVAARWMQAGESKGVILRRAGGVWSAPAVEGAPTWLAAGETLGFPADGTGSLIDGGSQVWQLASILTAGAESRALLKISASGEVALLCREGGSLVLGEEAVTVDDLGDVNDWTCGPDGFACGRLTVSPASGPAREVLVRWNGRHPLPVLEAGQTFDAAAGGFTVDGIRLDGGGTAEDGKGGYLSSAGEWVAVATASGGGDRLISGSAIGDLDGDGRDDTLEAALGGDPGEADAGVVLLGLDPVPAGAVLRFLRSTTGPFQYQVEACGDLVTWLPVTEDPVPAPDQSGVPAGFERMELPLDGDGGFARVRVTSH